MTLRILCLLLVVANQKVCCQNPLSPNAQDGGGAAAVAAALFSKHWFPDSENHAGFRHELLRRGAVTVNGPLQSMILFRSLVCRLYCKTFASFSSYHKSRSQGDALEARAMSSADMTAVRLLGDLRLSHGGTPSQWHQRSDCWYIERRRRVG